MSLSFRPVKEVWGEHSSCFVDADLMLQVLLTIATEAGSRGEAYEYGDKTSIWVEDGGKLLDFIRNERVFTAERIAHALGLKKAHHLNDLKFLVRAFCFHAPHKCSQTSGGTNSSQRQHGRDGRS